MKSTSLSLALAVAACGSSSSTPQVDASLIDSPVVAGFIVTSPAFAEGGAIPIANTCKGANTSPELTWTGAPAGTMSFAVVFTDLSLSPHLVHTVIYDIPATVTGLPAAVANTYEPANLPGAHQTTGYDDTTRGYLGPCPPSVHNYELAVYPLLAAQLPGATMTTTRADAVATITAHALAAPARLTGHFGP